MCQIFVHNQGALGRTVLSSERTFLAWVRTAIALITVPKKIQHLIFFKVGIIITRIVRTESARQHFLILQITGTLFIAFGFVLLLYAIARYLLLLYMLQHEKYTMDMISWIFFLLFGIAVTVLSLTLIWL